VPRPRAYVLFACYALFVLVTLIERLLKHVLNLIFPECGDGRCGFSSHANRR
jgi:hypothetical protein